MSRVILFLSLVAAAAILPAASRAQERPALKSVTISLPAGQALFPGPGADAINRNCLTCHSADMVLNQPALAPKAWAAEVDKMIGTYKAPIIPQDKDGIVSYLAGIKGQK